MSAHPSPGRPAPVHVTPGRNPKLPRNVVAMKFLKPHVTTVILEEVLCELQRNIASLRMLLADYGHVVRFRKQGPWIVLDLHLVEGSLGKFRDHIRLMELKGLIQNILKGPAYTQASSQDVVIDVDVLGDVKSAQAFYKLGNNYTSIKDIYLVIHDCDQ